MSDDLFEKYLTNRLRPEEAQQLKYLLRGDPAARNQFTRYVQEWTLTADVAAQLWQRIQDQEAMANETVPEPSVTPVDIYGRPIRRGSFHERIRSWFGPWLWRPALVTVGVLLIVGGSWILIGGKKQPPVIARVTVSMPSVEIQRGSDLFPVTVGTVLRAGDLLRTHAKGMAEFRYYDGTQVCVKPMSAALLENHAGPSRSLGKRLTIRYGRVFAQVAPQPADRPMTVATVTAEVRVLGTHLVVMSKSQSTEVLVEKGRVAVQRLSDGQSIEVPAGQMTEAGPRLAMAVRPLPGIEELAIRNLGADGIAAGWRVGADGPEIRAQFCLAGGGLPFSTIRFDLDGEAGGDEKSIGRSVESASIPVEAGQDLDLSWQWRGEGLYDVRNNQTRNVTAGRIDLVFVRKDPVTGSEIYLSEEKHNRYYFRQAGAFATDQFQATVPDGATHLRIRLNLIRGNAALGEESYFEVGDFKLVLR